MTRLRVEAEHQTFKLARTFTISRGSRTQIDVVYVRIVSDDGIGQSECLPYPRYGESVESVLSQIHEISDRVAEQPDREALLDWLTPGAARNALDCALWDWQAKTQGVSAWQLAKLPHAPAVVTTAYTLSLDTPEAMAAQADLEKHRPLLKIKLGADQAEASVAAIRKAAPHSQLIVDANEAWPVQGLAELMQIMHAHGVSLIEQPLPAADDSALADIDHPVPVAADESCHTSTDLNQLVGRYDVVNIKLDKTGGLTEALRTLKQAQSLGFDIMTGCMIGTSLAMAPAVFIAQQSQFVDLDGPLLLATDRQPGLQISDNSVLHASERALWG